VSFKVAGWKTGLAMLTLAAGLMALLPVHGRFAQPTAQAQNNLGQRAVYGRVSSENEEAVRGATVFLRNLKTKSIRTFNTDEKGHYRFTQVNMAEDHELWAEKDGKKSAVKTVSSWDARKEFESDLRLK
jgi:hypothetical protein